MKITDGPSTTFIAAAAMEEGVLVKIGSSGYEVAVAGLADTPIGVTERKVASGDAVSIRLLNGGGIAKVRTANAVAANATVYGRADGEVDDVSTSSGVAVGIALEAAGAADVLIPVLLT